jgi:transposase-like protein
MTTLQTSIAILQNRLNAFTAQAPLRLKAATIAELRALADTVREQAGEQCPECKCQQTEWNGHKGNDAGYRCVACDFRFGPDYE